MADQVATIPGAMAVPEPPACVVASQLQLPTAASELQPQADMAESASAPHAPAPLAPELPAAGPHAPAPPAPELPASGPAVAAPPSPELPTAGPHAPVPPAQELPISEVAIFQPAPHTNTSQTLGLSSTNLQQRSKQANQFQEALHLFANTGISLANAVDSHIGVLQYYGNISTPQEVYQQASDKATKYVNSFCVDWPNQQQLLDLAKTDPAECGRKIFAQDLHDTSLDAGVEVQSESDSESDNSAPEPAQTVQAQADASKLPIEPNVTELQAHTQSAATKASDQSATHTTAAAPGRTDLAQELHNADLIPKRMFQAESDTYDLVTYSAQTVQAQAETSGTPIMIEPDATDLHAHAQSAAADASDQSGTDAPAAKQGEEADPEAHQEADQANNDTVQHLYQARALDYTDSMNERKPVLLAMKAAIEQLNLKDVDKIDMRAQYAKLLDEAWITL